MNNDSAQKRMIDQYNQEAWGEFNIENYAHKAEHTVWSSHDWIMACWTLRDKPIAMLEAGTLYGLSSIWFAHNVLTHPDSYIITVDKNESEEARENFALPEIPPGKIRYKVSTFKNAFREFKQESLLFDIIYVDGGKKPSALHDTLRECWSLLKTGGLFIIDDYMWKHREEEYFERPAIAIDRFMTENEREHELIRKKYQVMLTKK